MGRENQIKVVWSVIVNQTERFEWDGENRTAWQRLNDGILKTSFLNADEDMFSRLRVE